MTIASRRLAVAAIMRPLAVDGRLRLAEPALLFGLMTARWATGFPAFCHIPYFYLSYSLGFIRRALVGTVTMPLLVGRPLSQALVIITVLGAGASLAVILVLIVILRRGFAAFDPIVLAFVASGSLAWLGSELGTLDPWLMLAVLGAIALLDRAAGVSVFLCAIAPLLHEGSLFLALPMLGCIFLLRPDLRLTAAGCAIAALIATATVAVFATTDFRWPAAMPIGVDGSFVRWELGQTLYLFLSQHWSFRFRLSWLILPFSVLPCGVIVYAVARRVGWRNAGVVLAGALASWSIVLIATDTDRLSSWGVLTAVVVASFAVNPRRDASSIGA